MHLIPHNNSNNCNLFLLIQILNIKTAINYIKSINSIAKYFIGFDKNIRYIPYKLSENFKHVKKIIIPNTITEIYDNEFLNLKYLKHIVIPDSVTLIGRFAFSGCESLKEIFIPDSVINISHGAFINCYSLIDISILETCFFCICGSPPFSIRKIKT